MGYVILAIVVILVLALIGMYNGIIRKKNYIKEAWSSIDVQLKLKSNVLTNLVDTIKMQTKYESETLEKIISMRSMLLSGNKGEAMKANDSVSKMIPSLFAMSESYPELKSNQSFLKLMEDIKNVEDKIAYARTRYNKTVTEYNTSIQTFPASLFAGIFNFKAEETYEISDVERDYSDNLRINQL
ncbi:LemA family protein [Sedimentibacter sp. zth1]|uniref:LemA family protein n=1 Tax=Sedimentibacter sp. zth1 TaxID=2816908 RepID=UPI001A935DC2|nr:LemA family protein [Sedimentibacter sp. zth1]QSX05550.1 LemA family protein [Sedimentibacter sp. zth1]